MGGEIRSAYRTEPNGTAKELSFSKLAYKDNAAEMYRVSRLEYTANSRGRI